MIENLNGQFTPYALPLADYDAAELDIGCGAGSFTVGLARRYPRRLIVGADVMFGRIRKSHGKASRGDVANVRFLRICAWELLGWHLPDAAFTRIHVICPDPWPKAKHRANRLVSSEFLGRIAGKLRPGGTLHLATDDVPYRATMLAAIAPLACYERDDTTIADIADLRSDFENRWAMRGIPTCHMGFRRV